MDPPPPPLVHDGGCSRKWLINVHTDQLALMLAFPDAAKRSQFPTIFAWFRRFWWNSRLPLSTTALFAAQHGAAAMTSRPLPSDTRLNTAPILQARIPEQWSPKQAPSLSAWQRDGLPFLSSIWVTHGDITAVEWRLKRGVKWKWRLSIRSAEGNNEIVSSSSSSRSAGALPTDTTPLRDCVCVKHQAESIQRPSTYLARCKMIPT